jgi:hypothetical protein
MMRIKDPQAEMTVWKIVLIAAVAMPFLVPWTRVTIPVTHPDTPSPHVSHTRGVGTALSEFDGPWPDTLSGGPQRGPAPSVRSGSPSFVPGLSTAARAPESA